MEILSAFLRILDTRLFADESVSDSFSFINSDKISINTIDENLLIENEEIMLHKVLLDLEPKINQCLIKNDFISALKNLVILNTPINNFFEKVMVNADDSKIKNNRYSLLFKLRQNLNCVADISKLAS